MSLVLTLPPFGLPPFIILNEHAVPLDDPPLSVVQRLTASMVPTIFAVRPTQTVHSLVGSSGLNCLIESLSGFWKVGRVQECFPTTMLKILQSHAAVVQKALIELGRFAGGVR